MSSAWDPEDMLGAVIAGGGAGDDHEIGQPVQIVRGLVVYGCAALMQGHDTPLRAANDDPRHGRI